MKYLQSPLQVVSGRFLHQSNGLEQSVRDSLQLLMDTPLGSLPIDPDYGFVFSTLRFEIFDENEGTVFDSRDSRNPIYKKKVSGSSKNLQTFASDLKHSIEVYEPRLLSPKVVMNYRRDQRQVLVEITGLLGDTNEPFQYSNIINVWN
ncbi:MAG: GPW/gp25 family protein [Bacteroidales bacterium]|nr:GPW/gp25 family protein [Bacteroidales bacterium]